METKRETISLKINPRLWKEAKKKAIDEEVSYSRYIENLIEKSLNIPAQKKSKIHIGEESVIWVKGYPSKEF